MLARTDVFDIRAVKARLIDNCESVCSHLFPAGKANGHEFRIGSLAGNPGKNGKGGSLAVELRGANRGTWCDFAFPGDPKQRGDIISLWVGARNKPLRECFPEMCRYVGFTNVDRPIAKPKPAKPDISAIARMLGSGAYEYLKGRGIADETMKLYRVRAHKRQSQHNTDFVAYQFWDSVGEFVMLKSRGVKLKADGSKDIWSTPPYYTLFGWWLVSADCRHIAITEGEEDAMSLHQIGPGVPVLSLPAGASNLTFIENDWDRLQLFERIDLYVDMDQAGEACAQEMARRLGRERCYRVPIPKPFKDVNECLTKGEPEQLEAGVWLQSAYSFDPPTLRGARDMHGDGLAALHRKRSNDAVSTFIWPQSPFQYRAGEYTIVSGLPNGGKSTFLYQSHIHEMQSGQRVLVASFEIPPGRMLVEFATMLIGHLPSDEEYETALTWLDGKLWFYKGPRDPKFHDLLEDMRYSVQRFGVTRVVIDSLFFLVGKENYEGQDQVSKTLKLFCEETNAHVALVAHSIVKLKSGFIPGMGDVEGSGGLMKPIDNLLIVHRNSAKAEAIEKADENGDSSKKNSAMLNHDALLIVAKNREDGRWHRLKLWFDATSRLLRTSQKEATTPVLATPAVDDEKQLF